MHTVSVPSAPAPTETAHAAATSGPTSDPEGQAIRFRDVSFENAVRDALGKMMGTIYVSDVMTLTELRARVCSIREIPEIIYFTNLETLDLYGNHITDLTPLAALTKLRILNISSNFSVLGGGDRNKGMDLTPLGSLTTLEELYAAENLITDVTPLAPLMNLRRLDLHRNRLTDVSALASCVSLETLNLAQNGRMEGNQYTDLTSVACIASMPRLSWLDVSTNGLVSLDGAERLRSLRYINASVNCIKSLPSLRLCTALEELYINNNELQDLSFVSGHRTLRVLDCGMNQIHLVPEILTMPSLREFYYEGNRIDDYGPIDLWNERIRQDAG